MLLDRPISSPPDARDAEIFRATVSADHYLRRVKALIDFDQFRDLLAPAYSPDQGRPALEPVLLLKLEFLQYQYNHSDRQVIAQARCNMAYRFFPGLALHSDLPDPSLLTYFRRRLGPQRHQHVFDALVGQARAPAGQGPAAPQGRHPRHRQRGHPGDHRPGGPGPRAAAAGAGLLGGGRGRAAAAAGGTGPASTADLSGEERLLQR